jgi:hypothetical protein
MKGWRFCPHIFGWSVVEPSGKVRFCRMCAKQQHLDRKTGQWVDGPMGMR